MSLKDKGNELFRTGKYQQAITCYEQYIEEDPKADKKVAYTNISFSHYKMKQYKESIEAADNAIEEDQTYAKAYFRKMHAYKEMGGNQYDVYINAILVLKYSPEMEEKVKFDTQTTAKQYKQKWMSQLNKDSVEVGNDSIMFGLACQNSDPEQQPLSQLTNDDWLQKWKQQDSSLESHWQEIEDIIVKKQQYGFNLAFLFLNQLPQPYHEQILQKIRDTQNTLVTKMDIESADENEKMQNQDKSEQSQSKESSSSDQNLFLSPQQKNKPTSSQKQLQNLQDLTIKDELARQDKSKSQTVNQQSSQSASTKKQVQTTSANLVQQSVEVMYEKLMAKLNNTRDILVQLLGVIEEILSSSVEVQVKRQLVDLIRERRQKEIKLMKTSLSKPEQQRVRDLLVENSMEQYMSDLASKHANKK